MELTSYEKDILAGKYGEGMAYALEIQLAIGNAFDADRFVPITRTHVALSAQDADLWFAEKMLSKGAKCIIPPTVNPSINLKYLNDHLFEIPKAGKEIVSATNEAYRKLGAQLTFDCTPYLQQNVPAFGEVIAFSESSATPYVNSVIGARTNREGSNSALCAAITGVVPRYGLLLDENRKAEIVVDVQAKVETDFDYQILGWCYPEKYKGLEIPVFRGIKKRPTPEGFMNFGAQLNTSGCVSMYHIEGITPEAPTLEAAIGGKKIKETIVITDKDLAETRERLCREPKKIDFAMFGCPHFTLEEAQHIAEGVKGKKLAIPMYILVSSHALQMAQRMGIADVLAEAGAEIIADSCPDQPCWHYLKGKVGITESPKYYPRRRGIHFIIRDLDTCIQAALTGEVK